MMEVDISNDNAREVLDPFYVEFCIFFRGEFSSYAWKDLEQEGIVRVILSSEYPLPIDGKVVVVASRYIGSFRVRSLCIITHIYDESEATSGTDELIGTSRKRTLEREDPTETKQRKKTSKFGKTCKSEFVTNCNLIKNEDEEGVYFNFDFTVDSAMLKKALLG
jgi:hypothetical protein